MPPKGKAGESMYHGLKEQLRSSPFVHADETGFREDGMNGYLWSFSTPDTRCYLRDPSRSGQVVELVLGETFRGRLVSDFYSAYNGYLGEHQRCWVHLLRDLHELSDKHAHRQSVQSFVGAVRSLFDQARAFEHPDAGRRRRMRVLLQKKLMDVVRPFLRQPVPQRILAERMERFLPELFVFVEHPDTPPDNNAAERAIRPVVVTRQVAGGRRSRVGSDTVAVLQTLFATWRLRGHDPLDCCRRLLAGTLTPDGNPAC